MGQNYSYWVSCIVQDTETSKPWLLALSEGFFDYDMAMDILKKTCSKHRVLSAWINKFNYEDNTQDIVFHECYFDTL